MASCLRADLSLMDENLQKWHLPHLPASALCCQITELLICHLSHDLRPVGVFPYGLGYAWKELVLRMKNLP